MTEIAEHRITVLIVDDHPEVRQAAADLLDESENIEVIGQASNGAEAVQQVIATHPDVVLMDLRMPIMDGVKATQELAERSPKTGVLIHSAYGDESLVLAAFQAGARGFIVKGSSGSDVAEALQHVAHGQSHISDEVARPLIDRLVEALSGERQTRVAAEEAGARLEGLVAMRREFAVQSAHELRTPVTLLLGNLEMLRDETEPDCVGRRLVDGAMLGVERLQRLTADLEVAASAEDLEIAAVRTELAPLVAAVLAGNHAFVHVRSEVPSTCFVFVDPIRFTQALRNVTDNAVSASPGGDVVIRVTVNLPTVVVDVRDTGPGFPKEMLAMPIDEFAHRLGASSGLGIGLWVACELITQMGGTLRISNNDGGGATVSMSILAGER